MVSEKDFRSASCAVKGKFHVKVGCENSAHQLNQILRSSENNSGPAQNFNLSGSGKVRKTGAFAYNSLFDAINI